MRNLVICSTVKPRYSEAMAAWAPWATAATSALMASLSCLVNKSHLLSNSTAHMIQHVPGSALIECSRLGTSPHGDRRQEILSRAPPSALAGRRRPIKPSHLRSLSAAGACRQPNVLQHNLRRSSRRVDSLGRLLRQARRVHRYAGAHRARQRDLLDVHALGGGG